MSSRVVKKRFTSRSAWTDCFAPLMQQSMERMHHGMSAAPARERARSRSLIGLNEG